MKWREFISLFGSGALWPLASIAQQPKRVAPIGFLIEPTYCAGDKVRMC